MFLLMSLQMAYEHDGNHAVINKLSRTHRLGMVEQVVDRQLISVPGELFSVNQVTAENVPGLFARNERMVCLFDTELMSLQMAYEHDGNHAVINKLSRTHRLGMVEQVVAIFGKSGHC
jgi:hypothetical protein